MAQTRKRRSKQKKKKEKKIYNLSEMRSGSGITEERTILFVASPLASSYFLLEQYGQRQRASPRQCGWSNLLESLTVTILDQNGMDKNRRFIHHPP